MSTHIQFTKPALLTSIVRLKNSRNGNPSYRLSFANGLTGKTKTDAGFAYAIHEGMDWVIVKYHFTPKGKCIIDDISEGDPMRFHVVLCDELGEEFSVTMYAKSIDDCLDLLDEEYPESSVTTILQGF